MRLSMRRVDVVAPRTVAGPTLRAIHRAGLLHLASYEPPSGLGPATFGVVPDAGAPTSFDTAAERVAELGAILGPAPVDRAMLTELWELDDARLVERATVLDPVRVEAADLAAERLRLDGELARLDGYRRIVEGLGGVVGRLPTIRGYGSTGIVVATRYRSVIPLVREELEALTKGRCAVVAADLGEDRVAAILLYPVAQATEVRTLLGGRELEEVTLPEDLAGIPFDALGPRLLAERERLVARRREVDAALVDLSARHGSEVAAVRVALNDRIAEVSVLRDAASSDHLVVVGGWIPERDVERLREALRREVGPEVLVDERPTARHPPATAPVAFEHGRLVRAFAPVAAFVSLPRYGTIDPTPLVALTFPAFVGLMVGDVGYGLVLLALLVLARRRWRDAPLMRSIWPIGLSAALATICFGVLFGEVFGDAGHAALGIQPLWVDRAEAVVPMLVLAVSIGIGQVGLGLLLGVVNAALLGRGREVASRGALLASLVSVIVLLAAAARLVPGELVPIAAATLTVALLVVIVAAGLAGPVEMVGILGNVLSYARLMAIGLASVMLALVANRLGGLVPNVLLGILVAGALHALNIVLGFFDASIQGLRLHYVEFFGRFLEPGGVRYEPFTSALGGPDRPAAAPPAGGS